MQEFIATGQSCVACGRPVYGSAVSLSEYPGDWRPRQACHVHKACLDKLIAQLRRAARRSKDLGRRYAALQAQLRPVQLQAWECERAWYSYRQLTKLAWDLVRALGPLSRKRIILPEEEDGEEEPNLQLVIGPKGLGWIQPGRSEAWYFEDLRDTGWWSEGVEVVRRPYLPYSAHLFPPPVTLALRFLLRPPLDLVVPAKRDLVREFHQALRGIQIVEPDLARPVVVSGEGLAALKGQGDELRQQLAITLRFELRFQNTLKLSLPRVRKGIGPWEIRNPWDPANLWDVWDLHDNKLSSEVSPDYQGPLLGFLQVEVEDIRAAMADWVRSFRALGRACRKASRRLKEAEQSLLVAQALLD